MRSLIQINDRRLLASMLNVRVLRHVYFRYEENRRNEFSRAFDLHEDDVMGELDVVSDSIARIFWAMEPSSLFITAYRHTWYSTVVSSK